MNLNEKYANYNHSSDCTEDVIIQARFTNWMEKTIYRAKLMYLRKQRSVIKTISIEEMSEYELPTSTLHEPRKNDFDFEEEKLARAFYDLPLARREVLRLLFVEELSPDDISRRLNCSIQHVYNQRSLAIKKLRKTLVQERE